MNGRRTKQHEFVSTFRSIHDDMNGPNTSCDVIAYHSPLSIIFSTEKERNRESVRRVQCLGKQIEFETILYSQGNGFPE